MTNKRKPMAVYAITIDGIESAKRVADAFPSAEVFVSKKFFDRAPLGAKLLELPMGPVLAETFTQYDCHVFIISVGAVVRMVAPLLVDKKVDPAVVCVDDGAKFSVSLLSGHVGRGNEFAINIANVLGALPVVTTASDIAGTLQVDILGRELGWTLDDPDRNVTLGCAAVVNRQDVMFVQEAGEPHWWPTNRKLPAGVQYTTSLDDVEPRAYEKLLIASDRLLKETHPEHWDNAVIYRPKSLMLGLGCDKSTPFELVERGVRKLLAENGLSISCVKAIASVDLKKDEPALLELSQKYNWPFKVYDAATLDSTPGIESPSEVVKKYIGTRAVAEPASLLAAGAAKLLLVKQKYTEPDAGRSMTLAVARIPFESRK